MFSGISQDSYEKWRDMLIVTLVVLGVIALLLFFIYMLPGILDGGAKTQLVNSVTRTKSNINQGLK